MDVELKANGEELRTNGEELRTNGEELRTKVLYSVMKYLFEICFAEQNPISH
jgi:hypothetical protein